MFHEKNGAIVDKDRYIYERVANIFILFLLLN